jgi:hypothetical protein
MEQGLSLIAYESWSRPQNRPVAAPMIATDSTPYTSTAICRPEHGGCGWRAGPFVTKERAKAAGDRHRQEEHGPAATEARRKARAQGLVTT